MVLDATVGEIIVSMYIYDYLLGEIGSVNLGTFVKHPALVKNFAIL